MPRIQKVIRMPNEKDNPKIKFARGLSPKELTAILQHELMRAREQRLPEALLTTEIVHEIKFRLERYADKYGPIRQQGGKDEQ